MCVGPETLLIGMAVAQAGASYMEGRAESAAMSFESQQYREQAEMAKIEAANAALQRAEENERIRRANIARAAGNGILTTSASTRAFLRAEDRLADRDIKLIRLGGRARVRQLEGQGNQAASAARSTFKTGLIKAGSSLISGAYDYQTYKKEAV